MEKLRQIDMNSKKEDPRSCNYRYGKECNERQGTVLIKPLCWFTCVRFCGIDQTEMIVRSQRCSGWLKTGTQSQSLVGRGYLIGRYNSFSNIDQRNLKRSANFYHVVDSKVSNECVRPWYGLGTNRCCKTACIPVDSHFKWESKLSELAHDGSGHYLPR